MQQITRDLIALNCQVRDKSQAIDLAGDLLYKNGYINQQYIESMHKRDEDLSVYIGNFVAIPHGKSSEHVLKTGLSLVQIPNGVNFSGNEVKIVFGIAGISDEHMDLISKIALFCIESENVEKLVSAETKEDVLKMLGVVE